MGGSEEKNKLGRSLLPTMVNQGNILSAMAIGWLWVTVRGGLDWSQPMTSPHKAATANMPSPREND